MDTIIDRNRRYTWEESLPERLSGHSVEMKEENLREYAVIRSRTVQRPFRGGAQI